ncbi:acyl-CoA thioesterase [Candidatus Palauibacter sp.]|uniref:acyl-CoA thioesterase n=1 Tax=Candidatus Palauibacter sp. TaxID=3101350 RepID=UPI003CC68B03
MRPIDDAGTVEVRVRYAETDQMGRAHHRHYLVWCELGRTTLMRAHGMSYAEMERDGLLLPVSRVEVEYRVPVGYDERVRIHTRLERVRSREIVFAYRIARAGDDATLARARTWLVCADGRGRPRRFPEDVKRRLGEIVAVAAGEESAA